MRPPCKHFYEFGAFSLDTTERLLLREGEPVPLTPKVFDLLLALIQHQGQVLEKDELLKQVWPDTFVEEANLSVHISALRKALGENPSAPQYIETLPRRGYRFLAPVKEWKDESAELVIHEHTRTSLIVEEEREGVGEWESGRRKRLSRSPALPLSSSQTRWLFVTAGVALLLVAGAVAWFSRARREVSGTASKTIAVLPFALWDAASEDQYLGLGMADSLITKLSNLQQIVVRPVSAVQKYAGQDPVAAGHTLKVDSVLEGSIQRVGERVRVTVRLLKVDDGAPLWAKQFDEKFTDIFAVEDSISERVAEALTLNLTRTQRQQFTKRYTENTEAYQLYLKGRYSWNKFTEGGFQKASAYFQQAIDKDPAYALAFAGLASVYAVQGATGILPPRETMPKLKAAAERALELDGTLAEAHTSLGTLKLFYEWDWPGAERELKLASQFNPNNADARELYAYLLAARGRLDEALAEIKRAQTLDPLALLINTDVGWLALFARQYDQAAEQYRKTLELEPNFHPAHNGLGRVYEQQGRYEEALAELSKSLALSGRSPRVLSALGHAYALSGRKSEAQQVLAELAELSQQRYISAFYTAVVYAGLAEKEQAFVWLNKAYEERSGLLIFLNGDPWFDHLHDDPRFADLLQRVGLTAMKTP